MADFSEAQNFGTDTGSAAGGAMGVSDAGAGKTGALANTASGLLSIFGQNQRQSAASGAAAYKQAQETEGSKIATAYTLDSMRIAEAVDSGAISKAEGASRMRAQLAQYASQNETYIGDLVEAHKAVVGTAGIGKVIVDGTEAEQNEIAFVKKAALEGFEGPEQVEMFRDIQQQTAIIKYETTQLTKINAELTRQGKVTANESARFELAEKQGKKKAQTALFNIGVTSVDKANLDYQAILEGDGTVEEKMLQLSAIKTGLINGIRAHGQGLPEGDSSGMIKSAEDNYDLFVSMIDGKIGAQQMTQSLLYTKEKLLSLALVDPVLQAGFIASHLGRDSDFFINNIGDASESFKTLLAKLSQPEGAVSLGNLEVTPRPGDASGAQAITDALTVISQEIQADSRGNSDTTLSDQRAQAVRNLLIGINEQTWNPNMPKGQSAIIGFLSDPRNARYFIGKHEAFSDLTDATSKALDVTGNQLAYVIGKEVDFRYGTELVFEGSSVQFKGGENMHTLMNMNDKMRPVINQYVRAKAHLAGTMDYEKVWMEEVRPMFFPAYDRNKRLAEIDANIY